MAKTIEHYFLRLSQELEATVAPRGNWPVRWHRMADNRMGEGAGFVGEVTVTGHHLEWIALLPDDLTPSRERIGRAIEGILRRQLDRHVFDRDLLYAPLSHLARALCLMRNVDPIGVLDTKWPRAA